MGLVVKQVLPMLMRRFHALPEDRLRAGLADMVQRLQTILGEAPEPVTPGADVSHETSALADNRCPVCIGEGDLTEDDGGEGVRHTCPACDGLGTVHNAADAG